MLLGPHIYNGVLEVIVMNVPVKVREVEETTLFLLIAVMVIATAEILILMTTAILVMLA